MYRMSENTKSASALTGAYQSRPSQGPTLCNKPRMPIIGFLGSRDRLVMQVLRTYYLLVLF
jgi:hypothetical protein